MALCREVIKLIRREAVNQIPHPLRTGEIAVMQKKPCAWLIGVLINVVDSLRVECARPADNPVDFISLGQQKFREIRPVLSGDSGDQCAFHRRFYASYSLILSTAFSGLFSEGVSIVEAAPANTNTSLCSRAAGCKDRPQPRSGSTLWISCAQEVAPFAGALSASFAERPPPLAAPSASRPESCLEPPLPS